MIREGFFDNVGITANAKEYGEYIVKRFSTHIPSSYIPSPQFEYDDKSKIMIIKSAVYEKILYKVDLSSYIDELVGFDDHETVKEMLEMHCDYIVVPAKGMIRFTTKIQTMQWHYEGNELSLKKRWPKMTCSLPIIPSPVRLCVDLATYINNNISDIGMGKGNLKELRKKLQEVIDKL